MTEYTDEELAQILDKDIFHLISEAADELQLECYVVGGYVRDIFLERPSDDIDCVVVGNGNDNGNGNGFRACSPEHRLERKNVNWFRALLA